MHVAFVGELLIGKGLYVVFAELISKGLVAIKVALVATYAPTNNITKGTPEEKVQREREREDFYHKFLRPLIEQIHLDTNEIIIGGDINARICKETKNQGEP